MLRTIFCEGSCLRLVYQGIRMVVLLVLFMGAVVVWVAYNHSCSGLGVELPWLFWGG